MSSKTKTLTAFFCAAFVSTQAQGQEPLSVIDWVQQNPVPPSVVALPVPQIERDALPPEVKVENLDQADTQLVGLVPARVTGLPETLWRATMPDRLVELLDRLPDVQLPAAQALIYALMLTEAQAPINDRAGDDVFTVARVRTLERFGALDPAIALAEQADVTRDIAHFAAYMDLALLTGAEDSACGVLAARPYLAPDLAHRVFCAVRAGDWSLAALLYDSGSSIGVFDETMRKTLELFLDPELADGADTLPAPLPGEVTPLLFRLREAIGEPLSTLSLPLPYAVADLRDVTGWKSQLEAAERLARAGALPANQLLGLYTERRPAASGGIWDRVATIQRFETALSTGSADAIAKTLPDAWDAMRSAGLAVPFATLFADEMAAMTLPDLPNRIARDMTWVAAEGTAARNETFDLGALLRDRRDHPLAEAVALAFEDTPDLSDLSSIVAQGRVGEALLRVIPLLENGAAGDPLALTTGLATLRRLGLTGTAEEAAAQILVLGPFSG